MSCVDHRVRVVIYLADASCLPFDDMFIHLSTLLSCIKGNYVITIQLLIVILVTSLKSIILYRVNGIRMQQYLSQDNLSATKAIAFFKNSLLWRANSKAGKSGKTRKHKTESYRNVWRIYVMFLVKVSVIISTSQYPADGTRWFMSVYHVIL